MDKKMPKRSSGQRPKKCKFRGNQFTKLGTKKKADMSASSKKLKFTSMPVSKHKDFKGYGIIDKNLVFRAIEKCVSCKICGGSITISSEVIYGVFEKISIFCEVCSEISSTRNSMMLGSSKRIPELNMRLIYAMRALGQGLLGCKTFCGLMDLPPPVSHESYAKIIENIKSISTVTAKNSMTCAVKEEILLNGGVSDITVSGDGTWKTRGHSSLVGVCTVIGSLSGKVIETDVLSSSCKGCTSWKGVREGADYRKWSTEHSKVCTKNHSGSAGMMEVVGMQRIFERSENRHSVRYAQYIGDGDCKTFAAIKKSEPYGKGFDITKIECVGHVQKRMGGRLRKRKQEMKGKKLSDGKTIGGKGRLTDEVINKLTIYYGNAIRKHTNSVKEMQKAIWAIFYHKRSSDLEPTHDFCPAGKDSWCQYQKALAGNKVENFKHKNTIPAPVMDAVKDVFKELSMPSFLRKCLGGHTQNPNESLNSLIWKFCPKTSGCGKNVVQIAVNEAVVLFNDGQVGRLRTMNELGFQLGEFARSFATKTDEIRVAAAELKAEMSTLEARRARKRSKIAEEEANELAEGAIYAAGMF